ncbi:MAG: NAD(P) transhydrogenase subunit alpha [Chloroflexota bacterium]|nr:NAD(P) transhydrogenase subunit alpha [Chloroflexota bacterium]
MGVLMIVGSLVAGPATQPASSGDSNTIPLLAVITVFALSVFLGFEIISKVPTTLHTPLMSGTNAIHGIVLVGAILVLGAAGTSGANGSGPETIVVAILGFIGVIFGAGNAVGGFVVTDRMLQMFKKRPQPGGKK